MLEIEKNILSIQRYKLFKVLYTTEKMSYKNIMVHHRNALI